MNSRGEYRK
jgi:hypothetical protein